MIQQPWKAVLVATIKSNAMERPCPYLPLQLSKCPVPRIRHFRALAPWLA